MKMARFILVTVLFFNLVIVPSIAFPFGNGYGFDKPKEGNNNYDDKPKEDNNNNYDDKPKEKPNDVVNDNKNVGNLKQGFYSGSCPNAEKIVADTLAEIVKMNPNAVANLLRLQFHDCFVVVSFFQIST
jgi:peroxidase